MKKLSSAAIALVLVVSACGGSDDADAPDTTDAAADTVAPVETDGEAETSTPVATDATTDDEVADQPSGLEADLVDRMAAEMVASGGATGFSLDESEAGCVAQGMFDELGLERLVEAGLAADDSGVGAFGDVTLTDGEAEGLTDVFRVCVDFTDQFAAQFVADGASEEQANCFADGMVEGDAFWKVLTTSFLGGNPDDLESEFDDEMFGIAESCGVEG